MLMLREHRTRATERTEVRPRNKRAQNEGKSEDKKRSARCGAVGATELVYRTKSGGAELHEPLAALGLEFGSLLLALSSVVHLLSHFSSARLIIHSIRASLSFHPYVFSCNHASFSFQHLISSSLPEPI